MFQERRLDGAGVCRVSIFGESQEAAGGGGGLAAWEAGEVRPVEVEGWSRVGYLDPADLNTYRVIIWDGLDFAYGKDPVPGDTQTTDPVVINHGINMSPRTADQQILHVSVAANDGGASPSTQTKPAD